MTRHIKNYLRPADWETAHRLLGDQKANAVPLFQPIRPRVPEELPGDVVVDLAGLGLDRIGQENDLIRIGTLTTLQEIVDSPLLKQAFNGILCQAAEIAGTLGLRNYANLGGVLLDREGPAEPLTTLLALDAQVVLHVGPDQVKPVGLAAYLADPKPAITSEIPFEIHIPAGNASDAKASLVRVSRTPRDRAIAAIAVKLITEAGNVTNCRIVAGAVSPLPQLLDKAGAILEGQPITSERVKRAAALAAEQAEVTDDFLASAEYRKAMVEVLAARALTHCLDSKSKGGQNG